VPQLEFLAFRSKLKITGYEAWQLSMKTAHLKIITFIKKTSSLRISLAIFISSTEIHLSIIQQSMKDKTRNSGHRLNKCMHISMLHQRKETPHFIPLHVSTYYVPFLENTSFESCVRPEKSWGLKWYSIGRDTQKHTYILKFLRWKHMLSNFFKIVVG
jgi:hypothetical protein